MTSDDKLAKLERAFEARIIDLANATDGVGLKIMITPRRPIPPGVNPITAGCIPRPEDFVRQIKTLMLDDTIMGEHSRYRGEEALARNISLLAKGWEACVRYWDFKKELAK